MKPRGATNTSGKNALFAFGVACQLSLVALAAYSTLGCELVESSDPEAPSCSDIAVTLFPGGCTYVEYSLLSNCAYDVWRWPTERSLILDDLRGDVYVSGGTRVPGRADAEAWLCATPEIPPYTSEEFRAHVLWADSGTATTTPVIFRVTVNTTRTCNRDLCIDASIDQSGPVPNQAQLSVAVDATGTYGVLWTADRVPSGINPGDETLEALDVTLSGETTYTATVTLTNPTPAGVVVSVSDSVTAVFSGGNQPPVAVDDVFEVDEGGSLFVPAPGVLANDSDPESDLLTVGVSVLPTNGTLLLYGDGSFAYTPTPGFNGEDRFSYIANDGTSDSNEATVTITVSPTGNQAPVGVPDAYAVDEDSTLLIDASTGVLANDTDGNGDPLTAALEDDVTNGTLVLNSDGSFSYTPDSDWNGGDSFSYRASDGIAASAPVPVSITVTSVNDPPAANAGSDVAVRVGVNARVDGSGSSDPDAGPAPLSYLWTFVLPLPPGSALTNASISGANSASASFTPDVAGRFTLDLRVSDGADSANDQVDVLAGNAAPDAGPDAYAVDEDGTLDVAVPGVLGNDSDPEGDPLTAVFVTGPSNGTLALRADGSFEYTPARDYNGADSFIYRANDGDLYSAETTVTITVNPINDAPVSSPDAYTTDEDVTLDVPAAAGVLANDSDADSDLLTVALVDGVANGTLTLNPTDGSFRYVPNANFNGADAFSYTATDGIETTLETEVTITVTPVADPPLANAGPDFAIRVNRLASVDGSASSDPDTGAPLASFLWTFVAPLPAGSALTNGDIAGAGAALASFTPDVAGTFTLNLEVSNGVDTASDQVNVLAGNSAPVANPDAYAVDEDSPLAVAAPGPLANDADPEGDPLTAILSAGVSNGALTLNANGSFLYTPAANFNGVASFSYVANDGDLSGAPALVTITVRPVNDPPTSSADAYSVDEDATLTVVVAQGVLANDADIDGDVLSATLLGNVANGSLALAANGSFVYTPNADYNGTDSFTYTTSDGTVSTAPATVTITIDPVNDAPVANAGPDLDGVVGTSIPLDGTGSSDIDGDTLTYQWSFTQVPTGSTAAIVNPTSESASFVPDASGQFIAQLVVNDGTVDSAPDTAIFLVTFCTDLTVNWVTNASGLWNNGANWSTGIVPGPGDNACIDVPANITVTHSLGIDSVASLVSAEDLVLSGGSLALAGPSFVYRSFTHSGGMLAGAGNLTVRGLFTWSGGAGTQQGPGQTIGQGGMSLIGDPMWLSGRTIVNPVGQTASWTGGSFYSGSGGGFVNNGTFVTNFDGIAYYNLGGARSVFANWGTIAKTGGAGTSALGFELTGSGSATSSIGTLAFTQGGTNSVNFGGLGTISLGGAVTPMVLSGSISAANIVFNGGTTEVNGIYNVSGSSAFEGFSPVANFNAQATVSNVGALSITAGIANFSSGEVVSASSLVQSSGALTGSDRVVVAGSMDWSGGEQNGPGTTEVGGGMSLTGNPMWLSGRTIVNAVNQTASWTGGTFYSGNGGGFVNNGMFVTNFDGIANYNIGGARSGFANSGTIAKTGGTGTSTLAFVLTGSGSATSGSGTLAFTGGGTNSVSFGGPGTISLGGAVTPMVLSGSISAANIVFNGGTTEVNGIYNVSVSSAFDGFGTTNFNAPATVSNVGALSITAGAANFSSGEVVSASSLAQSGGALSGSDRVVVAGSMDWSGGEQNGPGTTEVGGGMSLTGNPMWLSGRTIVNAVNQTASWTGGTFYSGNGGGFVNDGTFSTNFDGVANYNLGGARSVFANSGTIAKTGGTGTSALGFELTGSGSATSSSGTLAFTGGGTNSVNFGGPGTISLGGAETPLVLSGSISAANIVFNGGTTEVNGIYNVSGSSAFDGFGTTNFNAPATVSNVGALSITAGAANFSSGEVVSASSLAQSGGALSGSDRVVVAGSMDWSGGEQNGPGTTEVGGGMSLTGNPMWLSGRTIVNAVNQTASWTGGTFYSGNGGGFVNDGTFSTNFDGIAYFNLGGARSGFTNSGTLEKTGGTGTSEVSFELSNTGVVRSSSGTLGFTGGYAQTSGTTDLAGGAIAASAAPIDISGGSLIGSGSVGADLISTGTVAPAFNGPLSVAGSYAQSGAGALNIQLAGTGTPGTAYDQLAVAGAATLGGALNVSLANGFVPASGNSFVILTYGSATGGFTSQSLPPLGGGLGWNISVGATAVTLSVTP